MRNLTSKFKIGFGSFVDKVMLPFVNTHPDIVKRTDIDEPFSFRNNLKLTERSSTFTNEVRKARISTNVDSPEGGFDALMQVLVCDEQIGWREKVRKIIIFSTDAEFHLAGDGKLAGIVLPNDGKCHLNSEGVYDAYDQFDYPSIGQINEKAKEKQVNIIFAVKRHFELYEALSDAIDNAAFGKLDGRSTNVINIVSEVYNNISSRVEIADRSEIENSPISLRYFSQCGDPTSPLRETNFCVGVKPGQTFHFNVELTLHECPAEETNVTLILGTLNDHIEVEIDLLCRCSCEKEGAEYREENSGSCTFAGTRQCGVCSCNDGNYGNQCQCAQTQNAQTSVSDPSKCRPAGAGDNDIVCNGRGICSCETCVCRNQEFISGTFCQCDRAQCLRDKDGAQVCSGNGRCDCDHCNCQPGWEGKFCQCRTKAACVNKGDPVDKICSGNGDCDCGVCNCLVKNNIPYSGKYCEECPSCGKGKCEGFRACVQCDVWNSGKLEGEACKNCTYTKIPKLHSLEDSINTGAKLCTYVDEKSGCFFNFTYLYVEGKYIIVAEREQKCSKPIVLQVATSVIGGIVAIGVLTLIIWKILTSIHDRREFAKFHDEYENAQWQADFNPLYEDPSTTISNPAFATK